MSSDSNFDHHCLPPFRHQGMEKSPCVCTKHVAGVGPGDACFSRSVCSGAGRGLCGSREGTPQLDPVSVMETGSQPAKEFWPESEMRLLWKHIPGPGRIQAPWAAGPTEDSGLECQESKAGLTSEAVELALRRPGCLQDLAAKHLSKQGLPPSPGLRSASHIPSSLYPVPGAGH